MPQLWILLNTQSTIDGFSNGSLLTRIYKVKTKLQIRYNDRMKTTNLKGHLSGCDTAWYFLNGIANILETFEVVNDLKALISQKDNEMLQNIFDIYADQEGNDFIKEKIEEWDFIITCAFFGGDFEIFLMNMIYKMQIIINRSDSGKEFITV